MLENVKDTTTVVIGAGFYGLSVALFLKKQLGVENVIIIEKEPEAMTRASYVNQARVHNGYHYPRSILTAYRSAINFPIFVKDYEGAIVSDFTKHYAIASKLSKINARQFEYFCKKINVPIEIAEKKIIDKFNPNLIEAVFAVKEYAFDAHKLRQVLLDRIANSEGISIYYDETVTTVSKVSNAIQVQTTKQKHKASYVFNCTYAGINALHRRSGLPLVGLKHEIAEMALVELPNSLKDFSVTVMDGPFFSIMPFPTQSLHTLSHVRYTPHESWLDDNQTLECRKDPYNFYHQYGLDSHYSKMAKDAARYIPDLKYMRYRRSISDIKTVLNKSEFDDSRPILFKPHFGLHNYTCIMGGKLDNIYDVFAELRGIYAK